MIVVPTLDRAINRRLPVATACLVSANVFAFLFMAFQPEVRDFWAQWGLVAADPRPQTFLTHMFVHGGVGHLLANMIFLGFFGANVERRLGTGPYLAGYLGVGVAAGAAYLGTRALLFTPEQWEASLDVPMVGASGAVCGMMGMYLVLFGRRRITVAYFAFVAAGAARVSAWWFFVLFMALQLAWAFFAVDAPSVAYWAHVHGFLGGLAWALLLRVIRYPLHPVSRGEEEEQFVETYEEFNYIPEGPLRRGETAETPREVATRIFRDDVAGAFALIPSRFTRITPDIDHAVRAHVPNADPPRPHCLATTIGRKSIEAIRTELARTGIETLLYPAAEVLADPLVIRVREWRVEGAEAVAVDEFGQVHPLQTDEVFFLSAARVDRPVEGIGPTMVLDLALRRPVSVLRLPDADAAAAARLRAGFPKSSCSEAFLSLTGDGRPPESFENETAYGDYLMWGMQLVSTPFYRSRAR